jgi:hypothetical protein
MDNRVLVREDDRPTVVLKKPTEKAQKRALRKAFAVVQKQR